MNQDKKEIQGDTTNEKAGKRKVIPLNKTYLWGIIICLAALIIIIFFNLVRTTPVRTFPKNDYLALLRDYHENAIALRGITRTGNKSIHDIQAQVIEETDQPIIFPDWIPLLPAAEIIGVKSSEVGDDQVISLIFKISTKAGDSDKTENHRVDFLTIFNARPEIKDMESVTIENQIYYKYRWGPNEAYFWELDEDKGAVIYGVISDTDEADLELLATDSMRSIKNYLMQGQTETASPQVP